MDPFEEFEFKPLTEGIGFHKKSTSLRESAKKSSLVEAELNKVIPEPPPSSFLEKDKPVTRSATSYDELLKALEAPVSSASDLKITEPLPRSEDKQKAIQPEPLPMWNPEVDRPQTPPPAPLRMPLQSSIGEKNFIEKSQDSVGVRRGAADNPMGGLEKAPVAIRSALLDFVFVVALSLVFLVTLLLVTKVSLSAVVLNSSVDIPTQLSMILLFVAVMQMYVVVSRSFFGRTLGEWTFDYQMGSNKQQSSPFYPLRVALRSLLVTLTGVVVLPLISFVIRRDLSGLLTGLQLYRQRS